MDNRFYTYAWLRRDGTPYYIGKGTNKRAYTRSDRRYNRRPPKDESRILILKQNLSEKEAFKHERYMIAVFGRKNNGTGILINLTDGGEGVSGLVVGEETRRKMSKVRKGRILSEEHKKKVGNGISRRWLLTFTDGRSVEVRNLWQWAKENNYCASRLSELSKKKAKFHKDIVAVEKLGR